MLKAQHPDYELFKTGIHAIRGVACADCHMPYKSEGGVKFTDHHIQSPLNNVANTCQVCHREETDRLVQDVYDRQDRIEEIRRIAEKTIAAAHIETKDSVYNTILYNYEWLFSLSILPQDSVKIIFADTDLCPICKTKSLIETFVDKFYFYTNALNNKIYVIAVKGEGFSVGVNEQIAAPIVFKLKQNYPNPFNPTTTISFVIPNEVRNLKDFSSQTPRNDNILVTLKVYDILGREVATLVNEQKPAGKYEVKFDASKLSSGIYFYTLTAGSKNITKKMILLR